MTHREGHSQQNKMTSLTFCGIVIDNRIGASLVPNIERAYWVLALKPLNETFIGAFPVKFLSHREKE